MAKVKAKKLSYHQRDFLTGKGFNTKEWLFLKTEAVNPSGSKRSSKNDPKTMMMVIQHKDTGEIKNVVIED